MSKHTTHRALQVVQACESHAKTNGHHGLFITLTLPSRFHAKRLKDGEMVPNPEYEQGLDPREGQDELKRCWARVRASMHRMGYAPYGLRITEPHRDGTPHWHALMWMDNPMQVRALAYLAAHCFGAGCTQIHSFGKSQGRASQYVSKYLSKPDQREAAWASSWGIHRFMAMGLVAAGGRAKGGAA